MSYLNPGRTGLIGAPTYPMLRDATLATLFEILERSGIPHDYNRSENALKFRDTGTRVLFRPLDEFERLRGTNLAWFGLDELTYTPEEAWYRLLGRLRDPKASKLEGFAVWTPKGFDWVYRLFVSHRPAGYELIQARPFENVHLLESVPDFYERLKYSYDDRFYQQEVLGEYLNLAGDRVYHAFSRKDHVRSLQVDPFSPLMWALDFNVDPMCSVVVQIAHGKVQVLDEIVLRHATTEDACLTFLERFGNHQAGLVVYGDASGANAQTTGRSDYAVIRDTFRSRSTRVEYRVPVKNPAVRERVNLLNGRLRSRAGEVRLLVDPKCRELILDLEQVSYREGSGQIDKDRDRQRTHLSDALGYLVWQECRPIAPVGEQGHRLL